MSFLKFDGSVAAETPNAAATNYGTATGAETLVGGAGADALWAQGAGDLLIGGGGGDTFYIQGDYARVQASAGGLANQVAGWSSLKLGDYANVQNLQVGGDHTYAAGDAKDNIIYATGTSQQLYGGAGQDVLVGDGKSDTFIVIKGEGNDAIYGFNSACDTVRLTSGYTSFGQVQSHMTQVGADVRIDLGGADALVMRNLKVSQLSAANFQLQLDVSKLGAQTFGDEFNTLSLWKSGAGTWSTTFWYENAAGNGGTLASNNEQQWYINANYAPTAQVTPWTVANGELTLTAAPATSQISSLINGYKYTSGEINTYPTFAQTYGYFEMRADLPETTGAWPAFWLMPTDGSWPPELDVMETLTKDPYASFSTAHSAASGSHTMSQGMAFVPNAAEGFHTYGVLWTKSDLTWYVDGVEVFHTATPADMNKPMYMIANVALGGWGGAIDTSQFPAQMKVDYIRAYGLADGSSTTISKLPAPTTTTPPATSTPPVTTTPETTPPASTTPPPVPAPATGVVLTAAKIGAVLVGGDGADTLNASQGLDTLTGGAGADRFVFGKEPWAPIHITDFQVGKDTLDLSALFKTAGYSGTDPVADKFVYLLSDGNGGTIVRFDRDGVGSNQVWPNTIIDLDHVSPTGLTWGQLSGASVAPPPPPPPPPAPAGVVLTATAIKSVLTGGDGADTLNASQAQDTLTGGAGADHFVFAKEPWAPAHITDFEVGKDVLDLSALFKTAGYTGVDPVADKFVYLLSDGNGGTIVRFDRDGAGTNQVWPNTIIDLDHVSPATLTWAQLQSGWVAGQ